MPGQPPTIGKGEPWNPVNDCIEPLIEILSWENFTAPFIHAPSITDEYRCLDTELCYMWLQESLNPRIAADFKRKLDSCVSRWGAYMNRVRRLGALCWDADEWRAWFDHSQEGWSFKEEWDEITDQLTATQEYLRKTVALIRSKMASENATKGTAPAEGWRMQVWLWKLYERTLKVFFEAVLERICPR